MPLHAVHLAAVLVGDQNWSPARTGWTTSPTTGGQVQGLVVPGILIGVPRWWWWWDPYAGQLYQLPALA